MTQRNKISLIGFLFISLFSIYFIYLSQMLPVGAGPDENAHLRAAGFIYDNKRLPVYPDDKEELYFSMFGATRSFRPPLIYITSATVHHLIDTVGITVNHPYRLANALAGGLCALFVFLSLIVYTSKINLAIVITSAFMLMPQVSFIFSYLNADGIAIMACALILLSVCMLLKKGVTINNLIFFGICCGVLSLCKVTAWIFCLPVCLFAVVYILSTRVGFVKVFLTVFIAFALTAGWRIIFNVYHHGLDNPFNWNLDAQLNTLYATVNLDNVLRYKTQDISYLQLMANHDNFLSRTFLSFVGQLDWLRLRVGPLQYIFYGSLILLTFIASIAAVLRPVFVRGFNKFDYFFELSILAGSMFLFFMYMNFNINNNIQTQGKYVLPAFSGLLLLLVPFLLVFFRIDPSQGQTGLLKRTIFTGLLLSLVYIHTQALYKYVIPFYYSEAYVDTANEKFTSISLTENSNLETGDLELTYNTTDTLSYSVTGPDPRLYIKDLNLNTEPDLIHLKIQVYNSMANYYYYYWDAGAGMSENTVVRGFMPKGDTTVYQILPVSSLIHLRFDLGTPGTRFTIKKLEYSSLRYKPLIPLLNLIFNVDESRESLSS